MTRRNAPTETEPDDTDGALAYERALCFGGYLSERKAWPPREVQDAAEFRRHILAMTPSPAAVEEQE